ncbi:MAG: TIGR02710 family CRISPR-associated CARF protein, partial [Verrucomicrobiae bacterium]|nr:TIGR02710 family CRISPR-associated CARF protein [Verrucomicrobiae bacterium]
MNSSPNSSEARYEAVLISVGGAQQPVLKALDWYRPQHVWYFCSKNTRPTADQIQQTLKWHPAPRFIEVDNPDELGPCYRELRRKIHDILEETHVNPEQVVVDYTGGTKTMSAALVLVAVERFKHFNYVSGEQRENGGVGRVISGTEKAVRQPNPWTELAIREIERSRDLWADCQFEVAAKVLRAVAERVQRRKTFEALADLADGMAARHRLDFPAAKRLLSPLVGKLPQLYDGRNDHGLIEFVNAAKNLCQECTSQRANDTLLRELLDNAIRTARQSRYEDAAGRLYRAM